VNRASNKSKSGRLVSAAKVHFCCFLSELLCQCTPQLVVPCSISFRIDLDPSFSHTGQPGRKQTCFAAYRAVVPLFRPPLFRLGGRQEPLRYPQLNCNLLLINLLQKHDDYAQRARDARMVDVPFLFVYFFAGCAIRRETDSPSASTEEHACCVYLISNNVESLAFGEISPSICVHEPDGPIIFMQPLHRCGSPTLGQRSNEGLINNIH
jgi:hypothetical protein